MTDRLSVEDCFYMVRWNWSGALTNATQHLHSYEPRRELRFEPSFKAFNFRPDMQAKGRLEWFGYTCMLRLFWRYS